MSLRAEVLREAQRLAELSERLTQSAGGAVEALGLGSWREEGAAQGIRAHHVLVAKRSRILEQAIQALEAEGCRLLGAREDLEGAEWWAWLSAPVQRKAAVDAKPLTEEELLSIGGASPQVCPRCKKEHIDTRKTCAACRRKVRQWADRRALEGPRKPQGVLAMSPEVAARVRRAGGLSAAAKGTLYRFTPEDVLKSHAVRKPHGEPPSSGVFDAASEPLSEMASATPTPESRAS